MIMSAPFVPPWRVGGGESAGGYFEERWVAPAGDGVGGARVLVSVTTLTKTNQNKMAARRSAYLVCLN